jgi:hypothetical protein
LNIIESLKISKGKKDRQYNGQKGRRTDNTMVKREEGQTI